RLDRRRPLRLPRPRRRRHHPRPLPPLHQALLQWYGVIERFVESCRGAVAGVDPEKHVRALVEEVVADRAALIAALAEPASAGLVVLYRAADLTILDFAWAPW